MKKIVSSKSIALTFGVLAIVFLAAFYAVAWTEPSQNPPEGNVAPPLNESSTGQSKKGNLILNTDGILANGLIVSSGNVGIGTATPSQKLDVAGYVKGSTGLCIGTDCRISWPGGDGSGGGWTDDGVIVRLTDLNDKVVIKNGGMEVRNSSNQSLIQIANGSGLYGQINFLNPSNQADVPIMMRFNPALVKGEICLNADCRIAWPAGGGGGGGSGTVTSVGSGAGLTGGPITTSGTLDVGAGSGISVAADSVALNTTAISVCTNGITNKIIWDSTNNRLSCANDQAGTGGTTYSVILNKGLQIDGNNNFGIMNCTAGKIMKYNTSGQWVCDDDLTGGAGGISGSGGTGYIPKWNGPTSLTNSQIIDNGTDIYISSSKVGIGAVSPVYKLDVNGDIHGTWLYLGAGGLEGNINNADLIVGYNDLSLRSDSGNNTAIFLEDSPRKIGFYIGGVEKMYIDASGNVTTNGNLTVGGSIDIGWERVTSASSPNNVEQWSVDCSPGKILLGGGCYLYEQNAELNGSHPSYSFPNSTWVCDALGESTQIIAYAICANVVPH